MVTRVVEYTPPGEVDILERNVENFPEFWRFSEDRYPKTSGIDLEVPEMDPPQNSTYSRAQEHLLTPSDAKVTWFFVENPQDSEISLLLFT